MRSEVWQFQSDMLELEQFVQSFKDGVERHSNCKRSIYEEEVAMAACFDSILMNVQKMQNALPFYKSAYDLIEEIDARSWKRHGENMENDTVTKGDVFNVLDGQCCDILLAILDGFERNYGIERERG